jgi:hypothetical protein
VVAACGYTPRGVRTTADRRLPDSRWCGSGALGAYRATEIKPAFSSRRSSSSASATSIDGSGPPRSRGAGAARSTSQMRTGALGFVRSVVVFLICGGFRPRAA